MVEHAMCRTENGERMNEECQWRNMTMCRGNVRMAIDGENVLQ